VGEDCGFRIDDLMTDRALLAVRQGKGKRDRVVPIGACAPAWIERCLVQARHLLEVAHPAELVRPPEKQ
jgi:integrase/recombinase XerD